MSKQRNKRNTRRGRAKRWRNIPEVGLWWVPFARGDRIRVCKTRRGRWACNAFSACGVILYFQTRAAAMRAAEHLARGR